MKPRNRRLLRFLLRMLLVLRAVGRFIGRQFSKLPPIGQVLCLLVIYLVFQALVPILLIVHSESLGILWSVILGIYMLAVACTTGYIMSRRRIKQLKTLYGEDFVYKSMPREKLRDERRAARRQRMQELLKS